MFLIIPVGAENGRKQKSYCSSHNNSDYKIRHKRTSSFKIYTEKPVLITAFLRYAVCPTQIIFQLRHPHTLLYLNNKS